MKALPLAATALALAACTRSPDARRARREPTPEAPQTALAADAGPQRVPMIAQVPEMGAAPDGREIDVPLTWMYLVEEPAPTGSTPYAAVGAQIPCGYRPMYTVSERDPERSTVRLRMRAQWNRPEPPPPDGRSTCGDLTVATELVSLGQLRLGTWSVVDAVPHPRSDRATPAPAPLTQHVVADDSSLAPRAQRWTRPCASDADCASAGGTCAHVGGSTACLAPVDPWLAIHRPCADGLTAVDVRTVSTPERAWRACVASCTNNRCPGTLRCDPLHVCVPPPSPPPPPTQVAASPACG